MQTKKIFLISFISYFLFLFFSNYIAVTNSWWYMDDYALTENIHTEAIDSKCKNYLPNSVFQVAFTSGRPFATLWYSVFYIDSIEFNKFNIANLSIRLLQGIFHCLAASIAVLLLINIRNSRIIPIYCSILVFVLWPFNPEPVLWRSAGIYPLASFLSMLGVYLIYKFNYYHLIILGAFLIICSVNTNQVACSFGFIIYAFYLILNNRVEFYNKLSLHLLLIKKNIIIFGSYLVGAIVSILIAKYACNYVSERTTIFLDVVQQTKYLTQLVVYSLFNIKYYPIWFVIINICVFIVSIITLNLHINRKFSLWHNLRILILNLVFIIFIFTIPFLAALVSSDNWPAWRVMYLSTLILSFSYLLIFIEFRTNFLIKYIILIFMIITTVLFSMMSYQNSKEFVMLFEKDIKTLKKIESSIDSQFRLVVDTKNFSKYRDWNPYSLNYTHADGKISAFLQPWSVHPFIRRFSDINTSYDLYDRQQCESICSVKDTKERFSLYKIQNKKVYCMCP